LKLARQLFEGHPLEIWDQARRVGTIKPDGVHEAKLLMSPSGWSPPADHALT
jgi:hypothetical protein